jgi:hypothetical protein
LSFLKNFVLRPRRAPKFANTVAVNAKSGEVSFVEQATPAWEV